MRSDPPPLPAQGYLARQVSATSKSAVAAIAIDVSTADASPSTARRGSGRDYAVVGRTVLYHPSKLEAWLEAGGTRAFETQELVEPAKRGRAR